MNRISVGEVLDRNPIGPLQWRVAGLCFLVALLDGYDMQAMALAAPAVQREFGFSPATMGALLSASLLGLMAGALAISPFADRLGRKPIVLAATMMLGVFSLLTVIADNAVEFWLFRFLTGLGLGAAMPGINALTADYAPARRRALLMTAMFVGVPIGNLVGGLFAARTIEQSGWQLIFIVGGVAPLILLPVLWLALPESISNLVRRDVRPTHALALARRIDRVGVMPAEVSLVVPLTAGRSGVRELLSPAYRWVTLLIWTVFFCNLLMTFSYISWLPTVLTSAGYPLARAIFLSTGAAVGAVVGGLVIAWLIDRHGFAKILLPVALLASASLAIVGMATGSIGAVVVTVLLAGSTVGGLQFGLQAMATRFYPDEIRSTGLGWAFGVGRIGAIVGPLAMGILLQREWQVSHVFWVIALPSIASALCIRALAKVSAEGATEAGNR